MLLLRKGLDVAKQHSYRGISHAQAHILTCISSLALPDSVAGFSIFVFLLLYFLEREGAWKTSKS